MLDRVMLRIGFLLALAFWALAAPVLAAATDAGNAMPARVIAIGDLHGDHAAWHAIIRDAGLIDEKDNWAGGRTVLVQTGDVADRGPDTLKIIRDLMRLQRSAEKAGGRVVALVGNHETMNMTGDWRYVTAGEYAAFVSKNSAKIRESAFQMNQARIEDAFRQRDNTMTSDVIRQTWLNETPLGKIEHQIAWNPTGEIGKWIIDNPTVLRLGDTLFVHAGISAAYADQTPDMMNRQVKDALIAGDIADTSIIIDPAGPLWYRGLVAPANEPAGDGASNRPGKPAPKPASPEAELDLVLHAQHAARMIVGHTPVLAGIMPRYGDRLVPIDTGISRAYRGTVSYLEIIDGKLLAHVVPRPEPIKAGVK